MIEEISTIKAQAEKLLESAESARDVQSIESELFGKKSQFVSLKKMLAECSSEERKVFGQALHQARQELADSFELKKQQFLLQERNVQMRKETVDLSELTQSYKVGHLHVVTQTRDRLEDVFVGMGFTVSEGPEVENDWYNFEALNIPPSHPARGMWDTLYVDAGMPGTSLLRTHTSPVQIRVMQEQEPPIYSIMPGRVYRRDTADASHMPVFHQLEGLVVDKGISFAHLAGTLDSFMTAYFGKKIISRLRPSYFPFTEPSAEYDIQCVFCDGSGCKTCAKTGWLELGGCGMVHPNVFKAVGYDSDVWSGFAFGFGIDRFALMRHGINDIRDMYTNDVRFLEQF